MHAEIIRVKLLLSALLFVISFQAQATITIQSVGGVSYFEKDTNNNFTIYGGMTGTAPGATAVLNCTGDGSTTCDSCISATTVPATACNKLSVYGSLKISITFSSSVALNAAKIKITTDAGSSSTSEATEYALSSTTITASMHKVKTEILSTTTTMELIAPASSARCRPPAAMHRPTRPRRPGSAPPVVRRTTPPRSWPAGRSRNRHRSRPAAAASSWPSIPAPRRARRCASCHSAAERLRRGGRPCGGRVLRGRGGGACGRGRRRSR